MIQNFSDEFERYFLAQLFPIINHVENASSLMFGVFDKNARLYIFNFEANFFVVDETSTHVFHRKVFLLLSATFFGADVSNMIS